LTPTLTMLPPQVAQHVGRDFRDDPGKVEKLLHPFHPVPADRIRTRPEDDLPLVAVIHPIIGSHGIHADGNGIEHLFGTVVPGKALFAVNPVHHRENGGVGADRLRQVPDGLFEMVMFDCHHHQVSRSGNGVGRANGNVVRLTVDDHPVATEPLAPLAAGEERHSLRVPVMEEGGVDSPHSARPNDDDVSHGSFHEGPSDQRWFETEDGIGSGRWQGQDIGVLPELRLMLCCPPAS